MDEINEKVNEEFRKQFKLPIQFMSNDAITNTLVKTNQKNLKNFEK